MKTAHPKIEIIKQEYGLEGIYKMIERAGRTCYKSEDKITESSAREFVERMISSGHNAMLEHGTVYLKIIYMSQSDDPKYSESTDRINSYKRNKYSVVNEKTDCSITTAYITTNYRVLVENGWLEDLQYLCEPTEMHERRITVRFITDIGITREFNRHRVNSIAEESTRFCNYSKDKFDNGITIALNNDITQEKFDVLMREWEGSEDKVFIDMCRLISAGQTKKWAPEDFWLFSCLASQFAYLNELKLGWKPQQARRSLNLSTKSELVHTAFAKDWKHFFELRDCDKAHPDAHNLAHKLNIRLNG